MNDIPIFVDENDYPVTPEEMRSVAESILAKDHPDAEASHLAQMVLIWLDWSPEGRLP